MLQWRSSPAATLHARAPAQGSRAWARLSRDPAAWISGVLIAALVGVSVLAPLLAPHNPDTLFQNGLSAIGGPLPPTAQFPLGTDQFGRDELSRLLYGGRTALLISVSASAASAVVGFILGAAAGLTGGWVDTLVSRLANVLMSFPLTLFAVAMVMIVSPGPGSLIAVTSAIYWTYTARLVRAETMALKEAEFVVAARTSGATWGRLLWRHILPNVLDTVIVRFTLSIAQTFLLEAGLSYLGVGVQPPTPDWGLMVAQSQNFYAQDPGLVLYPGAAIALASIAFSVFGDSLRRALRHS